MSSRDPELFTCSRGTVIRVSLYIIFMLFIVECVNFSVYTKTYNIFKSYQRDNENSHTQLIKTGSLKTTTPKARVVEPPTEQRRVYKRICEHYELTQENVQCEPRAKCPKVPPNLVGPLANDTSRPSYEELTKLYPWLEPGGRYAPKNCIARYKVAVIIPFRDRDEHLRELLYNLHPVLRRQQKDYGLFVIEQTNGSRFNRAMLMNIGFTEAVKLDNYTCFIFHDVDLIPEDDRIIYDCSRSPRHLSFAVDKFNYKLPYPTIFGGVTALSRKDFEKVNGYSNKFFGWGGEDDDMFKRIRFHGLKETRYPIQIARYRMIRHKREKSNKANKKRYTCFMARYTTVNRNHPQLFSSK